MTTKTLGQVLFESDPMCQSGRATPWSDREESVKADYEAMAQAVAAVVREQCAQACEAAWHIDGSFTAQEFAAIIRSMKP